MPSQAFGDLLTPQMSVSATTQVLLNKIFSFQDAQRKNLDKLRLAQLQIFSKPTQLGFNALGTQVTKMLKDTEGACYGDESAAFFFFFCARALTFSPRRAASAHLHLGRVFVEPI